MKVPRDFAVDEADLIDVIVPNDLQSVKAPETCILDALARFGYERDAIFAVKLAYEEAVTNAIKHGNCNDRSRHVHIRYHVDPQRVVIMVRDEGCGFAPEKVPDPTTDENLERPCGRGIMLMSAYMTKLRYSPTGNEVWMLKENAAAGRRSARNDGH